MVTKQDLFQMYRREFGGYPTTQEYADWLEERELARLNELQAYIDKIKEVVKKPRSEFDDQMAILKKHRRVTSGPLG